MRGYLHDCGTPPNEECWPDSDTQSNRTYWSEADDTWDAEQIERAIGIKIEDEPTGDEEKRKLQEMDKNEIIDMLLRAKVCRIHRRPPLNPCANHGIGRLHLAAMCHLLYRFPRNQTDPASA